MKYIVTCTTYVELTETHYINDIAEFDNIHACQWFIEGYKNFANGTLNIESESNRKSVYNRNQYLAARNSNNVVVFNKERNYENEK